MPKPSTPSVWAGSKTFSFQPSPSQQAQGFDYIATVRPGTGAPITDDHDWPLNSITTSLKWVMDQLPDGGLKYGCPLVGSLIAWPLQQMPHEIWPDCGMVFIPYIGQAFDQARFPLLKQIHPSGTLPADMRGEFPRGWDNGRGIDAGRALMSGQLDSLQNIVGNLADAYGGINLLGSGAMAGTMGTTTVKVSTSGTSELYRTISGLFDASRVARTSSETRPRSIAWNMIVRAA